MKRTEIIPTLSKLFENPAFTITGTYQICWLDGKLDITHVGCPRQPEIVFATFRKSTITEGLTSKQWDALESDILSFLTQKGYL